MLAYFGADSKESSLPQTFFNSTVQRVSVKRILHKKSDSHSPFFYHSITKSQSFNIKVYAKTKFPVQRSHKSQSAQPSKSEKMPTRTLSSGQSALPLSRSNLTKPVQVSHQVKEGRQRIRSHLSVQDENTGKSRTSTSSQGTLEAEGKLIASELTKARDTQIKSEEAQEVPRKTSRACCIICHTKEVQAGSRKAVSSASLPVSGVAGDGRRAREATFIIQESRRNLEEKRELPQDVLNIEMEEGLYEFSREVHAYLWQMERTSSIPSDYLDQDAITGNMRAVLVDWLTQVQHHLKVSEETLLRTVIIVDTVLWQRSVEPDMLQLVIHLKYEIFLLRFVNNLGRDHCHAVGLQAGGILPGGAHQAHPPHGKLVQTPASSRDGEIHPVGA